MLAARLESGARDARRRVGKVGVGADDVRRIGAELAHEFLRSRRARQLVAGGGAAGDRDDGDQRMGGEQLGCLASARHDIEHPSGMPAFFIASASRSANSVPGGEGFTTTALPTAIAGATF